MDLTLSSDQRLLVEAVAHMAARHDTVPAKGRRFVYAEELQVEIAAAGFAEVALAEGFGPLDAALAVDQLCAIAQSVEAAASLLVAPMSLARSVEGPVALVADWRRPARFLGQARHALVLTGDSVRLAGVDPACVDSASGLFAYPMGRFRCEPQGEELGPAVRASLLQWWRVAIATEASAAMRAATDFTVAYVKDRQQFGQAIGAFQAVQHRLARASVHARGARLLALEAAWKGDALTASLAATYARRFMGELIEDMHQFNGAMGLTLDHRLHYWTYRLLALQGELGGMSGDADAAAALLWPSGQIENEPAKLSDYGALGW
jgi:alkylation response protein AidB-like acyl-CoA dehydrogenase